MAAPAATADTKSCGSQCFAELLMCENEKMQEPGKALTLSMMRAVLCLDRRPVTGVHIVHHDQAQAALALPAYEICVSRTKSV